MGNVGLLKAHILMVKTMFMGKMTYVLALVICIFGGPVLAGSMDQESRYLSDRCYVEDIGIVGSLNIINKIKNTEYKLDVKQFSEMLEKEFYGNKDGTQLDLKKLMKIEIEIEYLNFYETSGKWAGQGICNIKGKSLHGKEFHERASVDRFFKEGKPKNDGYEWQQRIFDVLLTRVMDDIRSGTESVSGAFKMIGHFGSAPLDTSVSDTLESATLDALRRGFESAFGSSIEVKEVSEDFSFSETIRKTYGGKIVDHQLDESATVETDDGHLLVFVEFVASVFN